MTKNRAGDAKITYKFTKSKYKKNMLPCQKKVSLRQKKWKEKTVYVKAAADDGSKKDGENKK